MLVPRKLPSRIANFKPIEAQRIELLTAAIVMLGEALPARWRRSRDSRCRTASLVHRRAKIIFPRIDRSARPEIPWDSCKGHSDANCVAFEGIREVSSDSADFSFPSPANKTHSLSGTALAHHRRRHARRDVNPKAFFARRESHATGSRHRREWCTPLHGAPANKASWNCCACQKPSVGHAWLRPLALKNEQPRPHARKDPFLDNGRPPCPSTSPEYSRELQSNRSKRLKLQIEYAVAPEIAGTVIPTLTSAIHLQRLDFTLMILAYPGVPDKRREIL